MRESRLEGFLPPEFIRPEGGKLPVGRPTDGGLVPLACRESEEQPQQAQAENHLPSLYGSPGAAWQDKPVGRYRLQPQFWYILLPDLRLRHSIRDARQGIEGACHPQEF